MHFHVHIFSASLLAAPLQLQVPVNCYINFIDKGSYIFFFFFQTSFKIGYLLCHFLGLFLGKDARRAHLKQYKCKTGAQLYYAGSDYHNKAQGYGGRAISY